PQRIAPIPTVHRAPRRVGNDSGSGRVCPNIEASQSSDWLRTNGKNPCPTYQKRVNYDDEVFRIQNSNRAGVGRLPRRAPLSLWSDRMQYGPARPRQPSQQASE